MSTFEFTFVKKLASNLYEFVNEVHANWIAYAVFHLYEFAIKIEFHKQTFLFEYSILFSLLHAVASCVTEIEFRARAESIALHRHSEVLEFPDVSIISMREALDFRKENMFCCDQFICFLFACILQVMCMQYWPPSLDKTEVYGDIHIGIVNEEQLANFQIRTFRIWKENLDVSTSVRACGNLETIGLMPHTQHLNIHKLVETHFHFDRVSSVKNAEYFNFTTPNGIRTRIHFRMQFWSFVVVFGLSLVTL